MNPRTTATIALLTASLVGQASAQTIVQPVRANPAPRVIRMEAPAAPAQTTQPSMVYPYGGGCCTPCETRHGLHALHDCHIQWLKPWTCEDLEMKPVECPTKCEWCGPCGWLHSLLWCPPEEKKNGNGNGSCNGEKKNGNGEKKNGEGEKKNGEEEKKNGNGNGEEEEAPDLTPLMQAIQCVHPGLYCHMEHSGAKVYGWIQGGFTGNPAGPSDRQNFGVNFNSRSNDVQLNQAYLVFEKALTHEKEFNWGYRVDLLAGTDAPFIVSNGLFDRVVNEDQRGDHIGVDLPQFYVEAHFPGFITPKGLDVRFGKFYTLHGNELTPAIQTYFYSHSYGFFYSWPFTHTGVLTTLHLTDTVDVMNGIVRGWDQFDDNNDGVSWHGMVIWTSCDKNRSFWVTWITGPEQNNNTGNFRTLVTYDYSRKFGAYNDWLVILHGANAWEANATSDGQDAQWYDYAANLFYTVDPRLILGARGEWFDDPEGVRTGFATSYFEVTAGVTYKPYQNLRIRPEIRFDWADKARPYNDQQDKFQFTGAIDFIWEF